MKKLSLWFLVIALLVANGCVVGAEDSFDRGRGYLPPEDLIDRHHSTNGLMALNDDLPEAYSLVDEGYVTPVKDQGLYGTCWTFAAMASAESTYLKETGKELDLSELKLAYFTFKNKGLADEMGLMSGDYFHSTAGDQGDPLNSGGNDTVAQFMLARGLDFVSEEAFPYTLLPENSDEGEKYDQGAFEQIVDYDVFNKSSYRLREAMTFYRFDNLEVVKRALIEYGALTTSVCYEWDYLNTDELGRQAYLYCYDGAGANHAVTIVGYDDNLSRELFAKEVYDEELGQNVTYMPKNDGAWLIKNSWGADYCIDGYFWLSYEDVSQGGYEAVCYLIEEVDEDDYLYAYDGTGMPTFWNLKTEEGVNYEDIYHQEANVYVAERDEYLEQAGFFIFDDNEFYRVSIYKGGEEGSPVSGELVYESADWGYVPHYGYVTVKLDEAVYLKKGERFTVLVEFLGTAHFFGDQTMYEGEDYDLSVVHSTTVEHEGQSYFSGDGEGYTDMAELGSTLRIKAYTHALKAELETDGSVMGVRIDEGSVKALDKVLLEGEEVEFAVKDNLVTFDYSALSDLEEKEHVLSLMLNGVTYDLTFTSKMELRAGETVSEEDVAMVKEVLPEGYKVYGAYDLNADLIVNGERIEGAFSKLKDKVKVKLEFKGSTDYREYHVYYVHDGKVCERINPGIKDGELLFMADEFSTYVVVYHHLPELKVVVNTAVK